MGKNWQNKNADFFILKIALKIESDVNSDFIAYAVITFSNIMLKEQYNNTQLLI